MSEPEFNPCDPSTWKMSLTVVQVAAIYQRTPSAVKKAVCDGRFVPAPYERRPSYRWLRVSVLRHLEGARGFSSGRKVG